MIDKLTNGEVYRFVWSDGKSTLGEFKGRYKDSTTDVEVMESGYNHVIYSTTKQDDGRPHVVEIVDAGVSIASE